MHIEEHKDRLVLQSDPWLSGLHVGVFFKESDGQANKKQVVLCFDGTASSRPGTYLNDITTLIGVNTSAAREATKLVKAFVKEYGAENVIVTGHSLGGALAANAALRNSKDNHSVQAVVFNAVGLMPAQRYKLGAKVEGAKIIHVNTAGDPLSQVVPSFTPLVQVGERYVIPNSKKSGHGLKAVVSALEPAPQLSQQLKFTGESVDVSSIIPHYFFP